MTAGQTIDYDALALEALRGVVKACLAQVSTTGLVGDHHFYIAFNTLAPGVSMSKRLKEKYPVEMTIVLQHRFWDLAVDEDRFEVKLTFDGVPERLVVPFKAVKVFYDPSVPYVLQFEEVEGAAQGEGARRGLRRPGSQAAPPSMVENDDTRERRRPQRRQREEREGDERVTEGEEGGGRVRPVRAPFDEQGERIADTGREKSARPVAPAAATPPGAKPAIVAVGKRNDASSADDKPDEPDAGGAKIFDLSKFRGKK